MPRSKKSNAKYSKGPRTSLFLKLPAELRNYIYELALPQSTTVEIMPSGWQPRILRVCKMTRTEASPIFHANNDFLIPDLHFTYDKGTVDWLAMMSREGCGYFRRVYIHPWLWKYLVDAPSTSEAERVRMAKLPDIRKAWRGKEYDAFDLPLQISKDGDSE